jgi:HSP20 family protein
VAMAIVRFDPFRDLSQMQDRINRIFGEAYRRSDNDDVLSGGEWTPPVDIFENKDHEIVLRAELPGLKKEDIDLKVENSTLTISGKREQETEVNRDSYHRVERVYGRFARSFSLPSTVDTEKVSAAFADGILTVTLPTREEAKPRQIQVQVH